MSVLRCVCCGECVAVNVYSECVGVSVLWGVCCEECVVVSVARGGGVG